MSKTLTQFVKPYSTGDRWKSHWTFAADNSYPTGGYPLKPHEMGFSNAADSDSELIVEIDNDYGYGVRYDYTNQKLLFYSSSGTQVTNGTDLSALTDVRLSVSSKYGG